ncbi:MAG: sulfotransferase domain-containing protein [Almyronema sp.]
MQPGSLLKIFPPQYQSALLTLTNHQRGRNITVFDDDIFITSYPKSGNTWLRFLIGYLLYEDQLTGFDNIEVKIPDIYVNREYELLRLPRPRVLKSHEYFDHRYKNVIYIVRDPRDVVISYFNFHKKTYFIPQDYPLEKYVDKFIAGTLDQYGSWEENVNSWIRVKNRNKRFLLIQYEHLLINPRLEIEKIADFFKLKVSEKTIKKSVEFSSAKNMKKLELMQSNSWLPTKHSRKDIAFIGSATSKTWKYQLPLSLVLSINNAWEELMMELGYL